jgi:hypothetical protein
MQLRPTAKIFQSFIVLQKFVELVKKTAIDLAGKIIRKYQTKTTKTFLYSYILQKIPRANAGKFSNSDVYD